MKSLLAACVALLLALVLAGPASAQESARRLRASIDSVSGQTLMLTTREGEKLTLTLGPNAAVTALAPTPLEAIKPGSYIGTAALPQSDGTLVALEVHVFMESMRGAGEGHRPWDGGAGSTMTNATVNTVMAAKADARGRMLTLTYPGGDKQVLVPQGVPVVAFEPGERSLLVPGAHVLVMATRIADGSYTAERITVGRNGLVPPM